MLTPEPLERRLILSAWPTRALSYSLINLAPAQKVAVERAFAAWDRALPGLSFHEIRDRGGMGGPAWGDRRFGDIRVALIPYSSPEIAFAHGPPESIRDSPVTGDVILNAKVIGNYDLYDVALHEIGHAIGLGHSPDPGDVMYPYYTGRAALGPGDVAAARSLYP